MIKKFLVTVTVLAMMFGLSSLHAAAPTTVTVYVNGVAMDFSAVEIEGNYHFCINDMIYAIFGEEAQFEENLIILYQSEETRTLYFGDGFEIEGPALSVFLEFYFNFITVAHDSFGWSPQRSMPLVGQSIDGNLYFTMRDLAQFFNLGLELENDEFHIDTTVGYFSPEFEDAILELLSPFVLDGMYPRFRLVDVNNDGVPEIFVNTLTWYDDGQTWHPITNTYVFMYTQGEFRQLEANDFINDITLIGSFHTDNEGRLIYFSDWFEYSFIRFGYFRISIHNNELIVEPILTGEEGEMLEAKLVNHLTGEVLPFVLLGWPNRFRLVEMDNWEFEQITHIFSMPSEPLTSVAPFVFLEEWLLEHLFLIEE